MEIKEPDIKYLIDKPLAEFHQIDNKHIAFKVLDFLDTQAQSFTVQDKVLEQPLFNIHLVDCLGVLSYYVIHVPLFNISLSRYYLRIRRAETLNQVVFKGANFTYQDKYLSVVHSDDGASLVFPSKLSRVIKPEMVRKTDKNNGA